MSTDDDKAQTKAIYNQFHYLERRDERPGAGEGAPPRKGKGRAPKPPPKPRNNAKRPPPGPFVPAPPAADRIISRWKAAELAAQRAGVQLCAEKIAAIRGILGLHAKGLVTDANALAVITDITKEAT